MYVFGLAGCWHAVKTDRASLRSELRRDSGPGWLIDRAISFLPGPLMRIALCTMGIAIAILGFSIAVATA